LLDLNCKQCASDAWETIVAHGQGGEYAASRMQSIRENEKKRRERKQVK